MIGAKCKTCGAREHNHVCSTARIEALELPSVAAPEPTRAAEKIIGGLRQAAEHGRGERGDVRATAASLYAPEGECGWCDRRRKSEAARIKAWRTKKRGGS